MLVKLHTMLVVQLTVKTVHGSFIVVLGIGFIVSYMLDKHSATEVHSQPLIGKTWNVKVRL